MSWELRDVSVAFDTTVALSSVSLAVAPGETVVVLGPSGCGKSTLLRVLAGLQAPDSGSVVVDGADVTDTPPHRRGIGLMFQEHALFGHRDVGANVAFGLRMAGLDRPARRRRVAEMLELVGLEGYESRGPATLSGGEAQRVALARALAPGPGLVLLDEPLGSLDRALRDRLVDELPGVLEAAGTAAVHVTHDHDEAFALADRLVVMDEGAILRDGTPTEVWADPRSARVAVFLGHTNVIGTGAQRRVVRADAGTVTPDGDRRGTVLTARFRGSHWDAVVDVEGLGPLRLRLAEDPGSGSVQVTIDPARIASVERD